MAAFLSRFSDKQLKDVRTCGTLADPSSCCDRARWTLPCLGAAIPMWQSGRFPSSRDGHDAMLVIRKNLRNVTCHVGLAYGCIIYIYIYWLAAIPITCITLVHDVLLNIHWHKLAHGNTLELRQSKDLRSPISRHNRQARLIGQKKRCS